MKIFSCHPSLRAGCRSLLAIFVFLCIQISPVNAQNLEKGEDYQFTFKDVAFDVFDMDGMWIDKYKKIVPIQYGGYNYFVCCSSPYLPNPVFYVMRSTDLQQLMWSVDEDGNILGYKETKDILIPGIEIMTPEQRQEYMQLVHAQFTNAVLIISGRVKEQRQQ